MSALARELAERVRGKSKPYWIAIAGVPGSGKSTLTKNLCEALQQLGVSCQTIPMDGYHYYRYELDKMQDPKLAHERRGAHWTFNAEKFVADLKAARDAGYGQSSPSPSKKE
eukprot:c16774_g1_i4.p2 GENE.c16774_g1_i4~~c16774_g1_i4.p2  ORF type:complete len:125 (+),score=25.06 c16774_g1_i4:41-376(+)